MGEQYKMKLTDFFDQIERDEILEGMDVVLGERSGLDAVVVRDTSTGSKTRLLVKAIAQHEWDELRPVILGQRDSHPLYHVTRIVGYFSRIENWNKSKIGELADRRVGDYRVSTEQLTEDLQLMPKSA